MMVMSGKIYAKFGCTKCKKEFQGTVGSFDFSGKTGSEVQLIEEIYSRTALIKHLQVGFSLVLAV